MDFFDSLLQLGSTLPTVFTIKGIVLMFLSVSLGVLFGTLPGLTATMGVALLTGLTFNFNLFDALAILIGIYIGAIYGGSRTAILINIPGTPSSAATILDAKPLVGQGHVTRLLTIATVASFIGTVFGIILLFLISPLLVSFALKFGAHEFFVLTLFGLIICGSLTSKEAVKGWIAGCIGLLISCIGIEKIQAYPRFTYDSILLSGGIELIPVMIGVFGIPQIILALQNKTNGEVIRHVGSSLRDIWNYSIETFKHIRTCLRSGAIGSLIGSLPGVGGDIACWVAYDAEKRANRKDPIAFGQGNVKGVIAPEVANNAVIGGAFIPMLSLAVPGDAVTAVILGALWLHGVRPGPLMMFEMPDVYYSVVVFGLLGSLCMLIVGLFITPLLVRILSVPKGQLMPIVAVLTIIGAYAINMKIFDVQVMLIFGIIGYLMHLSGFPVAPLILGMILGPMADENLRRALMLSDGSLLPFIQRPISASFLVFILILVGYEIYKWFKKKEDVRNGRYGLKKML